jgi:hypothetical protein
MAPLEGNNGGAKRKRYTAIADSPKAPRPKAARNRAAPSTKAPGRPPKSAYRPIGQSANRSAALAVNAGAGPVQARLSRPEATTSTRSSFEPGSGGGSTGARRRRQCGAARPGQITAAKGAPACVQHENLLYAARQRRAGAAAGVDRGRSGLSGMRKIQPQAATAGFPPELGCRRLWRSCDRRCLPPGLAHILCNSEPARQPQAPGLEMSAAVLCAGVPV